MSGTLPESTLGRALTSCVRGFCQLLVILKVAMKTLTLHRAKRTSSTVKATSVHGCHMFGIVEAFFALTGRSVTDF